MKKPVILRAAIVVVASLALPLAAHADSVPAAAVYITVGNGTSNGGATLSIPGTVGGGDCYTIGACGTATVTGSFAYGDGAVFGNGSVSGLADNVDPLSDYGAGDITFYFEVLGGTPNEIVQLVLTAGVSVAATGNSVGNAFVNVTAAGSTNAPSLHACTTPDLASGSPNSCAAGLPTSESGSFTFTALANFLSFSTGTYVPALDSVEISGDGETFSGAGTWSFSADPMISFAPGFDSSGLSIVFSPNFPGSAPTPEPGTLLLLGSGLLGLGPFLRTKFGKS